MTVRRLLAALAVVAGAAGCTAFLLSASHGMRDVMVTDGGSCASGGPYVIARQCSGGDMRLLLVGILVGLVCAAVYAAGTAGLGQAASTAGLLAWTALFGVFGWNFFSLRGSLVTGVVFWLMAFGGLVLASARFASGMREAGRPRPVLSGSQPLVRAVIPPGLASTGWQPTDFGFPGGSGGPASGVSDAGGAGGPAVGSGGSPASPGRAAAIVSAWLAATSVGAAVGIVVSAPLISLLK